MLWFQCLGRNLRLREQIWHGIGRPLNGRRQSIVSRYPLLALH